MQKGPKTATVGRPETPQKERFLGSHTCPSSCLSIAHAVHTASLTVLVILPFESIL